MNNEQKLYLVECSYYSIEKNGKLEDVGSTLPTALFKTLESAKKEFEIRKQWAKDLCIYDKVEEDEEQPRDQWQPIYEIEEKRYGGVPPINYGEYIVWRTGGAELCFRINILLLNVKE